MIVPTIHLNGKRGIYEVGNGQRRGNALLNWNQAVIAKKDPNWLTDYHQRHYISITTACADYAVSKR